MRTGRIFSSKKSGEVAGELCADATPAAAREESARKTVCFRRVFIFFVLHYSASVAAMRLGSRRHTLPCARDNTQIAFSPKAIETGSGVTSTRAMTRLVSGLIRMILFSPGHSTHSELSANRSDRQLAASRVSETMELVSGSTRV